MKKIRIAVDIISIVTACWVCILIFTSGAIFGPAPETQLFRYAMFGFVFSTAISYGFDIAYEKRSVRRKISIALAALLMLAYLFFVALPTHG